MKCDYKGYVIVRGWTGSTRQPPYTAHYSVYKPSKPGATELKLTHHGSAAGVFQTPEETWVAAAAAARAYIDAL
jgi:hypothetical protein